MRTLLNRVARDLLYRKQREVEDKYMDEPWKFIPYHHESAEFFVEAFIADLMEQFYDRKVEEKNADST